MATNTHNKRARKRIIAARTALVLDQPFFGALVLKLRLKECSAQWFAQNGLPPTAGVDGRTLYYCADFVNNLRHTQVTALLAHETLHCFPAGTVVPGSGKTIEELRPGDVVIDKNGERDHVVAPMARDYEGGLVTINARAMLPMDVTPEHPILVTHPTRYEKRDGRRQRAFAEPEWKLARDVEVDDWVYVPRIRGHDTTELLEFEFENGWSVPQPMHDGVVLDEEIAEFLGWYVAEGYAKVQGRSGLCLHRDELEVGERLADVLGRRFGYSTQIYQHPTIKTTNVGWESSPLARFLNEHCGAGAHNKRMPEFILYHENEELLRAFLRGYIAGDGYVTNCVSFATVSKVLAMQVQLAFARLGGLINMYERPPQTTKIRGGDVNSGTIYIGASGSQRMFDIMGVDRTTARPTQHWGDANGQIVTPIKEVTAREWSGKVYNCETATHTYTAGNIVTHNCSNGHPWRRGGREPRRWNISCDAAINPLLTESGFDLPDGGVTPGSYNLPNGKSSEWYHDRVPVQERKMCRCGDEGDGDGDGEGGDGDGTCPECGGQRGNGDGDGDGEMPEWGSVMDAPGDGHEDATTEADWKQATQQAANAAKMRGKLPGALERYASIAAAGQVDWKSLLRKFVQQSSPTDYSWRRPNRRHVPHGIYMPSLNVPSLGPVLIGLDTSGSIDQTTMDAFFGEVNSIVQDMRPAQVDLLYCDAAVQGHDTFHQGDPIEPNPRGGGGTRFEPVFEALEEDLDEEPVCIIYLTDMHGSFPEQEPGIPTLWVSTTREAEAPFGQTVYIDV